MLEHDDLKIRQFEDLKIEEPKSNKEKEIKE